MIELRRVESGQPLADLRQLWRDYWTAQGFEDSFQNFGAEFERLPAGYERLFVAYVEGLPAGAIAMKRLDTQRAEAKRLYVDPQYRGQGVARVLLEHLIAETRALGFESLYSDTMPSMQGALSWYRRIGFRECEPYSAAPTPGAIYLRLSLNGDPAT